MLPAFDTHGTPDRTAEPEIVAASVGGKLDRSRHWSLADALMLAVLALVAGVLIGRQSLTSQSAVLALVGRTTARGAGFVAARLPLGGTGKTGGFPPWSSQPAPQRPTPKAYYLPAELGVHHYTMLGKLEDGPAVVLHLWLALTLQPSTDEGNGTITMQGFGMFQSVDPILVSSGGSLIMPPAAEPALRQQGYLYLVQRPTARRFNVTVRSNGFPARSTRSPFHLSCTLPGDVAPPGGGGLEFHIGRWRRFQELPVDHMLAVRPDMGHRGRFRVAVWTTPQMTGPQAARLVPLHARYHVDALGFHEEQARTVYLWPDQMAHCLRDPDVLDLVSKEQLKLVLIEQFPEIHTYCPRLRVGPSAVLLFINSSIEPDAQGCEEKVEQHGIQSIVNSHIVLANLGEDAYVLNVDIDEFLVTDKRTTLEELAAGCFKDWTAVLGRMNAICAGCEEKNVSESELWMDRSVAGHPLAQYTTYIPFDMAHFVQKVLMKADRVWSVDVHDVQEFEGFKKLGRGETHACGARILHAFNMFRVRATPQTADLSKETVTYLWALQNLEGG